MSARVRAFSAPVWAGILLAALVAAGCGHRGSPVAPLPRVPVTPSDVEWRQRGDVVAVHASYVLEGLGGRSLRTPLRPVVLYLPAGSAALAAGWGGPARAREFQRLAKPVPLEPLLDARPGEVLEASFELPVSVLGEEEFVVLALSLEDARSRSLPSPRRAIRVARPAISAPEGVRLTAEESGIGLLWDPPADSRAEAAVIYRQEESDASRERWAPWRVVPAAAGKTFDADAAYGKSYRYTMTWTSDSSTQSVQSAAVSAPPEGFLAYEDVFPPRKPRDLDAVAETGRIRVFWFEGGSDDERLVVIERQTNGEEGFSEVGRAPSPDAWFEDHEVSVGISYRYRAYSVDDSGNASEPAGPTGWVAPRAARENGR